MAQCRARGGKTLDLVCHDGNYLAPPGSITTGAGQPYKIYTPFWRALREHMPPPAPLPVPHSIPVPEEWPDSDRLADWALLPTKPDWAGGFRDEWTPGEKGATERLEDFIPKAAAYDIDRNLPSDEEVRASRRTCISARYRPPRSGIMSPGRGGDTTTFLKEVAWRDYAQNVILQFPDYGSKNGREALDTLPWRTGSEAQADLRAWQQGRTGYPIVDAGMRQLWAAGWMHNRVRMIAASFLIKHLLIDWREGEAWFWDTLVDADYGNNSVNWQWTAGTGVDSNMFVRIMAPLTQSMKFDAADYIRQWVPELAQLPSAAIHDPDAADAGPTPIRPRLSAIVKRGSAPWPPRKWRGDCHRNRFSRMRSGCMSHLMNASAPNRGRRFGTRAKPAIGLVDRILAPFAGTFHHLLDRIDLGLEAGSIEAALPDGTHRVLGGRGRGAGGDRRDRKLARADPAGDGRVGGVVCRLVARRMAQPGSGAAVRPVHAQLPSARRSRALARADAGSAAAAAFAAPQSPQRGAAEHRIPLRSGQRLLQPVARPRHDLFERAVRRADPGGATAGRGAGDQAPCHPRPDRRPTGRHHPRDRLRLGLVRRDSRAGGVKVHGITLSAEQKRAVGARMADAGLDGVTVSLTDYRDVAGQYDAVASIEMVEAVGEEYWPAYLQAIARALKPGGRAAIQYIAIDDAIFDAYANNVDFIQRYVFPGGMPLSESRFRATAEAEGLAWHDRRSFALHYAETSEALACGVRCSGEGRAPPCRI